MLTETGRLGMEKDRWFRDPSKPVPRNEITRFPHAVLEVKLQLKDENSKPQWVTDLLNSGGCQCGVAHAGMPKTLSSDGPSRRAFIPPV
jgi:hypothetical protein